jgi:uncharacterized phage protein (TIGR01671 family)
MREPKYRAWHKSEKKMYPVKSLTWFDKKIDPECRLDTIRIDQQESAIVTTASFFSPYDVELMEFTGLKDTCGCEIYEDDVVIWAGGQYTIAFSEVVGAWILKEDREDRECPLLYGVGSSKQSEIEVTGNMWENENTD